LHLNNILICDNINIKLIPLAIHNDFSVSQMNVLHAPRASVAMPLCKQKQVIDT